MVVLDSTLRPSILNIGIQVADLKTLLAYLLEEMIVWRLVGALDSLVSERRGVSCEPLLGLVGEMAITALMAVGVRRSGFHLKMAFKLSEYPGQLGDFVWKQHAQFAVYNGERKIGWCGCSVLVFALDGERDCVTRLPT